MHVPTNSPEFLFSMPNVFIVPPEEDDVPPWCCFNADDAHYSTTQRDLSLQPSPESIQERLNYLVHESIVPATFHRTAIDQGIIMPSTKHAPSGADPYDLAEEPSVGNDSDVVEVVKVGRSTRRGTPPERCASPSTSKPMTRSKTFRSRASKALSSIKSLGKSHKSTKPSVRDVFVAAQPPMPLRPSPDGARNASDIQAQEPEPPVGQPSLSRRSSVILSNIFHPPKSRPSVDAPPVHGSDSAASSIGVPYSSTSFTLTSVRSSSPTAPTPLLQDGHYHTHDDEDEVYTVPPSDSLRPISPCFSTMTTTSTSSKMKRRFSKLNLQRIFSFSSSPSSAAPVPPTPSSESFASPRLPPNCDDVASLAGSDGSQVEDNEDMVLPTQPHGHGIPPEIGHASSTTSSASASSASMLDTPTDAAAPPMLSFTFDSDIDSVMALKMSSEDITVRASALKGRGRARGGIPDSEDDPDIEMRLDSLHFDSLSFDPETFDLSELIGSG
ncbi:hypothetical protein HGRIS_013318 [Hohenbuehelia grisea]|uniref:Uncharacterized protein n=1 Tax=Hohenbuehelia grisea TaxID=104357 RepID=A0ABR3IVF0_9AGAR